jgi:hypothetical protein
MVVNLLFSDDNRKRGKMDEERVSREVLLPETFGCLLALELILSGDEPVEPPLRQLVSTNNVFWACRIRKYAEPTLSCQAAYLSLIMAE